MSMKTILCSECGRVVRKAYVHQGGEPVCFKCAGYSAEDQSDQSGTSTDLHRKLREMRENPDEV